jgi:NADH-quinone oxidoreductase subunit E
MLTAEEREEIEAELGRYPTRRAACVEALMAVQRRRGWVSDECLREVSELLGMTPDELDGVATFYSLIFRKAVGRNVILLCDSISCWIMGSEGICGALTRLLGIRPGQTTPDDLFTLLPVPCLGACDHAPAMMMGRDLYGDLAPEKIASFIEQRRMESGGVWKSP